MLVLLALSGHASAQNDVIKHIQLAEFVVHRQAEGFDLEGFMAQVMEDTTFYHAFLNTRYHPHALKSGLRVRNKDEKETASLYREAHLVRDGRTAELVLDSVRESGRLREHDGDMRYLTAEMYDDVFFPKGPYTASNRVSDRTIELDRSSRFEKYKSELKKFMFNPGQEIASVPFIGDKLDIFDPSMVPYYDYTLDSDYLRDHSCWVFTVVARDSVNGRPAHEDDTVIKRMTTWFDDGNMNVIARQYRIAHASLFLDFDITIHVDNAEVGGELVPTLVRYEGDWDIPFKKRELVRFHLAMSDWRIVP